MLILNPTLAMLTEAQQAYHSLLTGSAARVVVDQNGERVEFIAANRALLGKYIQDLQIALGLLDVSSVCPPTGPLGFTF